MQTIELKDILRAIKYVLDIDLLGKNKPRERKNVDARRIYAMLAVKYTSNTLTVIAKTICRDHASIIYYNKTNEDILLYDKEFVHNLNECELFLTNTFFDYRKEKLLLELSNFKKSFKTSTDPFLIEVDTILNHANL